METINIYQRRQEIRSRIALDVKNALESTKYMYDLAKNDLDVDLGIQDTYSLLYSKHELKSLNFGFFHAAFTTTVEEINHNVSYDNLVILNAIVEEFNEYWLQEFSKYSKNKTIFFGTAIANQETPNIAWNDFISRKLSSISKVKTYSSEHNYQNTWYFDSIETPYKVAYYYTKDPIIAFYLISRTLGLGFLKLTFDQFNKIFCTEYQNISDLLKVNGCKNYDDLATEAANRVIGNLEQYNQKGHPFKRTLEKEN